MTSFEQMKRSWQMQSDVTQERFDEIASKVVGSSQLLHNAIVRRDVVESFASLLVILFLTPALLSTNNWVAWCGFACILLAGITIPVVLWRARRKPQTLAAGSFRDFVDVEIDYLSRQIRLLRMVTWWYLVPIYVGIFLGTVGMTRARASTGTIIFATIYLICCALFCVWVWRLNQKGRKNHFEPLLRYYVSMRDALDSGSDFSSEFPEPPTSFLRPKPREPMSMLRRGIWIATTLLLTAGVAGAGIAIRLSFNERTGVFIAACAPFVALLMLTVSGAWKPNPKQTNAQLGGRENR